MPDQNTVPGTLVDVLDPEAEHVDRDAARSAARQLRHASGNARLVVRTASGDSEPLPRAVADMVASLLEEVAQGNTVAVVSEAAEVGTSAAAAFLGVSRPHVVKLIDAGLLPRRMAGSHRRVRMTDLVAYKRMVDQRHAFLDELAEESQQQALYDDPPTRFAR
jgi:excisionase family DNA binding protein